MSGSKSTSCTVRDVEGSGGGSIVRSINFGIALMVLRGFSGTDGASLIFLALMGMEGRVGIEFLMREIKVLIWNLRYDEGFLIIFSMW
jgi:hypothetical protein